MIRTNTNLFFKNHKASLLEIKNLTVKVSGTDKILVENFNLTVEENSLHVIIGGNGSGKTSLFRIISGSSGYQVVSGGVFYKNFNLTLLNKEQIANLGIIMSFQYPVEIPGITSQQFLETALNSKFNTRYLGNPFNSKIVKKISNKLVTKMKLGPEYLNRDLNTSFSGGERKRNELVQIFMLDKKIHLFDELDSGLDFDGITILEDIINYLLINQEFTNLEEHFYINKRSKNNIRYPARHSKLPNEKAIIAVTHSSLFMISIFADFVHLMDKGQILVTADPMLAERLIKKGGFTFTKRSLNTNNTSKKITLVQDDYMKTSNSVNYLIIGIILVNLVALILIYNQIYPIKFYPVPSTRAKALIKASLKEELALTDQEIQAVLEAVVNLGFKKEFREFIEDLIIIYQIIRGYLRELFRPLWDPFHFYH